MRCISATSVPGRILPSYLGDRIGHFNVITVCCFLTGIDILALWLPFDYYSSHAGIIVFALIYGSVSGAFVSLLMPCVARSGTLETLGRRFGTFQAVIAVRLVAISSMQIVLALEGEITALTRNKLFDWPAHHGCNYSSPEG